MLLLHLPDAAAALSVLLLPSHSIAMDIWKSKVLPKIKLVFVKSGGKKAAAAAELVKSFDESKVSLNACLAVVLFDRRHRRRHLGDVCA